RDESLFAGGGMSDPYGVLDQLVSALAVGDREGALQCFGPGATVVMSGSHHDYASYAPPRVIDGLLHSFMEISWTPSLRRVVGGARVEEGVLAATHIGPFLGSEPSGERVLANLRISSSVAPDGRVETLSVWGSREAVLGQLGVTVGAAGVADTLVATARERLTSGVRDYTPEEIAAFPVPSPPPHDPVDLAAPPPHRPIVPALAVRQRSRRQVVLWGVSALALLALLAGVIQVSLRFLPGADAVAGAIAVSVVTPTPKPVAIATIPPIIKESTQQGVAKLGSGVNPLNQVTILNSSTNAGLALVGPNVQFEFDSAVITPAAQRDVQGLADSIVTRGLSGTIFIHGYTDDLGTREHGLVLSAQRAEAVAQLLQDRLHGHPVRLITAGYGEEDPIADNRDPVAQALNRRVMVLYKPPVTP
ncbi:MAG TPA: OmpA family protein, partial [Lapillicoccus sp.]|nr:OmpA family protein [Lapillicoccus sp.]